MALDVPLLSSAVSLLVGLIAAAMTVLALQARARSGNRQLGFVGAAFALFLVKSLFSAYNVRTHAVPHDLIELWLSVFDLAIIGLLFMPLVTRARASRA